MVVVVLVGGVCGRWVVVVVGDGRWVVMVGGWWRWVVGGGGGWWVVVGGGWWRLGCRPRTRSSTQHQARQAQRLAGGGQRGQRRQQHRAGRESCNDGDGMLADVQAREVRAGSGGELYPAGRHFIRQTIARLMCGRRCFGIPASPLNRTTWTHSSAWHTRPLPRPPPAQPRAQQCQHPLLMPRWQSRCHSHCQHCYPHCYPRCYPPPRHPRRASRRVRVRLRLGRGSGSAVLCRSWPALG